jgi:hypothetical protein
VLALLLLASSAVAAGGPDGPLDQALELRQQASREAIEAQRVIDALDDETREALFAYRAATEEAASLEVYNTQLERLVASQAADLALLARQLDEIEVTKRRVFPFLERMLGVLEEFVALDKPFLVAERKLRLSALAEARDRADISLAEKFRRLIEAYQIEAEYGRTVSAERETVPVDGAPTTVDVLRFGRVGLYYLTLDGARAGMWNTQSNAWESLDDSYRRAIGDGLAIARREKPPELVRLPVFTGAVDE